MSVALDRERLAKFLGMTESSSDGKALNAGAFSRHLVDPRRGGPGSQALQRRAQSFHTSRPVRVIAFGSPRPRHAADRVRILETRAGVVAAGIAAACCLRTCRLIVRV
jgi:hypothetical protein